MPAEPEPPRVHPVPSARPSIHANDGFTFDTDPSLEEALPDADGVWPEIEWAETQWNRFLTPETAERVRGYADEQNVPLRDAVTRLLEGALDQFQARQAGGRKRWLGVTPSDRSELASRASQARWGTRRATRPTSPPDTKP